MGCLAAYFTHVQSCDVTLVQSAIRSGLLPYILHIRTLCIYRPSRHVRTSHAGAAVDRERHVTSRQDVTGAAVDKEAVTSRHVTSGRHRRRRGQGGRHVTSRHVTSAVDKDAVTSRHVTSGRQAPSWTRRPSRHVTSRHVTSRHVTSRHAWTRRPSRHVTSRHDVRRPQSGPCSLGLVGAVLPGIFQACATYIPAAPDVQGNRAKSKPLLLRGGLGRGWRWGRVASASTSLVRGWLPSVTVLATQSNSRRLAA